MVDEQKLRQLAEAATPGPWMKEGHTIYSLMHFGWRKGVEQFKNRFWTAVYKDNECPEEERQANADFIAAANPAAILSLLDELQTLREERTAWSITAENAEKDAAKWRGLCNASQLGHTHKCKACHFCYTPEGEDENCPVCGFDGVYAAIDAAMKDES